MRKSHELLNCKDNRVCSRKEFEKLSDADRGRLSYIQTESRSGYSDSREHAYRKSQRTALQMADFYSPHFNQGEAVLAVVKKVRVSPPPFVAFLRRLNPFGISPFPEKRYTYSVEADIYIIEPRGNKPAIYGAADQSDVDVPNGFMSNEWFEKFGKEIAADETLKEKLRRQGKIE